jgi:uncharacterized protein YbaR (Trm112 family)
MTKICPKCKKKLPVSKFNKSNRRDGYQTYCRECHSAMQRAKYNSSPEEKVKRQIRAGRRKEKNPLVTRDAELRRLYGITLDDYIEMFKKQNGVCAICGYECQTKKSLSVDHDHKTGKVRGLLCNRCNRALGMFRDDVNTVRYALNYLCLND